jgi:hypothetical protein
VSSLERRVAAAAPSVGRDTPTTDARLMHALRGRLTAGVATPCETPDLLKG